MREAWRSKSERWRFTPERFKDRWTHEHSDTLSSWQSQKKWLEIDWMLPVATGSCCVYLNWFFAHHKIWIKVSRKIVAEVMMMIREVWTLNTIPSLFDLPSLFVFPWPILEASSHFYLGSCFGFTLITPASIAKSSLFGFGLKCLESDWLLLCYPGLLLAQWNPSQIDST